MTFCEEIEQEIKDKGLTAARVTKDHIDSLVEQLSYKFHVIEGTTTTSCAVFLKDFMLAQDYSACVSPANFDEEIGRKIAKERAHRKAVDELWKLEGYALSTRINS